LWVYGTAEAVPLSKTALSATAETTSFETNSDSDNELVTTSGQRQEGRPVWDGLLVGFILFGG